MARIEKTVFISYRRTDVYTALAVYENLKNQGYDVFFDYRSISSGDFEQIITSNIKARAHFLLILTQTALDRCSQPGDWLRREIEVAMDEKRNIIPLFFKGFRFGDPSVSEKLTGKLKNLSRYNGLNVHEDYFDEAMQRLRIQYLNIPLETVLHPVSTEVQRLVKAEQVAADKALEQIPDVKELAKQDQVKPNKPKARSAPKQRIQAPTITNVVSSPDAADDKLEASVPKVADKPKQTIPKEIQDVVVPSVPTKKPSSKTSMDFRLLGGIAGGLLILVLLVWGSAKLLRNAPGAVAATNTVSASAILATQPIATNPIPSEKANTSTPSLLPFPTDTNAISVDIATISCYGLQFMADVTIPDNTLFIPGQSFTKTWKVKNAGSCAWDTGFKFAFTGGDSMSGKSYILMSPVAAGAIIDISIAMVAPNRTGTFRGNWRMSTASGQFFGDEIYVQIVVGDSTSTTQAALASRVSDKDGMTFLYVPAGKFTMGAINKDDLFTDDTPNEKPIHVVYLDAFWIDKTEITNAMYKKCVDDGSCSPPTSTKSHSRGSYYGNPEFADYPVIYVSWEAAKAYCLWAGRRLPTEAEWEKAARGDDERKYPWGNENPGANFLNKKYKVGDTAKVGQFPDGASPYGALDMAGNVWEWVADWYSDKYYASSPESDPLGPESGQYHVLRGGSWNDSFLFLDHTLNSQPVYLYYFITWRVKGEQDNGAFNIGFRCAMSAAP